jgi:cytosine/adenosine deaminase-related metal-dependent hydrolase
MRPAQESDSAPLTRLKARWIVPACQPPLENAVVEMQGGTIRAVQSAHRAAGQPCTDLGDVVLLPGLINAHAHLELTALAGAVPRSDFWTWLSQGRQIVTRLEENEPEWRDRGVRQGAAMCLAAGTTCVGDISRTANAWSSLADSPIRTCCFAELLSIAQRPPRDPPELAAAIERMPNRPGRLWPAVTAHAPYTVTAEHIAASAAFARDRHIPWAIHLAETAEEVEWLRSGRGRVREFLQELDAERRIVPPLAGPIEYLRRLGGLGDGCLIVHGNYLTGNDLDLLAEHGGMVIYCPRAHRWFGHPRHPLIAMIERGIPVAIGTDSLASNESLSMLEELICVRQAYPQVSFEAALALATTAAAHALRCPAGFGTIQPGGPADLLAVAVPRDRCDSVEACLQPSARPVGVWIAGQRLA